MRPGLLLITLPLCLIACRTAPQAMPREPTALIQPVPVHHAAPAPAPAARSEPRAADEAVAMAVLRTHLLHLLPCALQNGGPAEVAVGVSVGGGAGGGLIGLRLLAGDLPGGAARCVLSRLAWWDLPPAPAGEEERVLRFSFPLMPPSINDHVAVAVPGVGSVALGEITRELRRLRPRALTCLAPAPPGPPRIVLLSLHLGEWGRLLDFGVEADTALSDAGTAPGRRQQERACLRRVLRQARFPNPRGEVEVRFPYVVLP